MPRRPSWQQKQLEEAKAYVKSQLDAVERERGTPARLPFILERINALVDGKVFDSVECLECFVYVMSALVHHGRHGGLKRAQIQNLMQLGHSILYVQAINVRTSTLAFIFSEFNLALSQVHRREGEHWLAAWMQQAALHRTHAEDKAVGGVALVAMGHRALRLGNAAMAQDRFAAAQMAVLPPAQSELTSLGQIKAHRLAGQTDQALAAAQTVQQCLALSADAQLELAWEIACCRLRSSANLDQLVEMSRRGGTHYLAVYVFETALWVRTTASRQWLNQVPRTSTLARIEGMKTKRQKLFVRCVAEIENLYDHRVPLPVREQKVGNMLREARGLASVEKELLVWAAAARGLARCSAFSLAALALTEYQALSMRLSNGDNGDALGTMGDMLHREWHPGRLPASA